MSVLAPPAPVAAAVPVPSSGGVALGEVLGRLASNLLVACVVPSALLYVLLQTAGLVPGLLGALAWSYGATIWRHTTGRPVSGLLVLAVVVLTLRTAFTLATGNAYVYFLEPIVTDAVVGLLFLSSLACSRPLVARLAADFYPLCPRLAASPRVRRLFHSLTLMWGGVCLVKAGLGLWLLESLSTADFVLVKTSAITTVTVLAVAATICAATSVLRSVESEVREICV